MIMVHKEVLYHFSCGNCKQWFSISDKVDFRKGVSCPHCGMHHPNKEVKADNFKKEEV